MCAGGGMEVSREEARTNGTSIGSLCCHVWVLCRTTCTRHQCIVVEAGPHCAACACVKYMHARCLSLTFGGLP